MAAQRRRRRRAPEESRVLRIGGGGESEEQRAEDDEEGSGSRIATVSFPLRLLFAALFEGETFPEIPLHFRQIFINYSSSLRNTSPETKYAFSGGKQLTVPEPSSGRQRQLHVEVQ